MNNKYTLFLITIFFHVSLISCVQEEIKSNSEPVVSNQTFTVEENSNVGTEVGTIEATDPEKDSLTFSIISAELNALTIDKISGKLFVVSKEALDYENITTFMLEVEVSDGEKISKSIITIDIIDVPEYALQFDGVDGQVIIPDASALSPKDEFTMAMWIRLEEAINCDENANERGVILKGYPDEDGRGYNIRVSCDGALAWYFGTENGTSLYGTGEGLMVDKWTFLAFVYDGNPDGTAIYIDGVKNLDGGFDPDQIGSGFLLRSHDELHINELNSSERPYLVNFPGSIDDLSLWNVALGAYEIDDIIFDGIVGNEPGLVSYWSCNADSGFSVTDQVSVFNGTMAGGVDWVAHEK